MKRMSRLSFVVALLVGAAVALVAPASADATAVRGGQPGTAVASVTAPEGGVTPQALSCGHGRLSDIKAFGQCSGSGKWRLAISCTWGYSGKTVWISQIASTTRTTKQCGWGSLRDEWIEVDYS